MSIAAYARSKGIEIQTVNGMVSGHSSVGETWMAIRAIIDRSAPPVLIGFSNIDTFDEVLWLAEQCRSEWRCAKIAIGNTFATLNSGRLLRDYHCFDFVIKAEGEAGFTLLAKAILDGGSLEDVPALAWRQEDGRIRSTALTAMDLDTLPWPSREELPAVLRQGFAASVFTSRGCPYRCTFCGTGATSEMLGRDGYRVKSIGNVVDEIEYLITEFGVDFISITDDLFLVKHPRMQERAEAFANEIIRRKLKVRFMFDARLDSVGDLKLLAHLKQAGLCRIFIGLETGSYEQLLSYGKRQLAAGEDAALRIKAIQDLDIEVIPGTIMFHPEVKSSELAQTLRLLRATGYHNPQKLSERIIAYPGTPLYDQYAAKRYLTKEWPIGEWDFVDPNAGHMFRQVEEQIHRNEGISFVDAESLFLSRLAEWDAIAHQDTTQLPPVSE